jgi:hypothetical protein
LCKRPNCVYNLWRQDGHLISPWSDKSSLPCHLVFVQQMDKVQYKEDERNHAVVIVQ